MGIEEILDGIAEVIKNNSNIEVDPDDGAIFTGVREVFKWWNEPINNGGVLLSFKDGSSYQITLDKKT